jgi:stage IV sporulation protein FB
MLVNGYFRVARPAGVELRLHWSVPVGALIVGGLRFEPLLWLGFMLVIIIHELGHAALVRLMGLQVVAIELTGIGGQCRCKGQSEPLEHAWIAWGGVLAQGLLLLGTLVTGALWGRPASAEGALIRHAFVETNLWIMGINLLPFPPFDGARAWGLFGELTAAGWTPGRAVLYPFWRWARQRRHARQDHGAAAGSARAPAERPSVPPSAASSAESPGSSVVTQASADDDTVVKPSAQAQRELAALLERIGNAAGKAKRRRE